MVYTHVLIPIDKLIKAYEDKIPEEIANISKAVCLDEDLLADQARIWAWEEYNEEQMKNGSPYKTHGRNTAFLKGLVRGAKKSIKHILYGQEEV